MVRINNTYPTSHIEEPSSETLENQFATIALTLFNAMDFTSARNVADGLTRLAIKNPSLYQRACLAFYRFCEVVNQNVPILHLALRKKNREVVRLLLEFGVNPNTPDFRGRTALHKAALMGNKFLMKLLIQYDANVHAEDHSHLRPIHYAAKNASGDHPSILKLLIEAGADVNILSESTTFVHQPLHFATEMGYARCVRALLKAGADITKKNTYGEDAYRIATLRILPCDSLIENRGRYNPKHSKIAGMLVVHHARKVLSLPG